MHSRLGQLETPGRVPSAPMSGLNADEEDDVRSQYGDEDMAMGLEEEGKPAALVSAMNAAEASEDVELAKFTSDPAVRARLLEFLRTQGQH